MGSMIFANKIRDAQKKSSVVKVKIMEGISHGFLQFLSIFPLASQAVKLTSKWMKELMEDEHELNEGLSHREMMHRRRQGFQVHFE
jgi:hypothetical protein